MDSLNFPIKYSIVDGFPSFYAEYFTIDSQFGTVKQIKAVDTSLTKRFSITVKVSRAIDTVGNSHGVVVVKFNVSSCCKGRRRIDQSSIDHSQIEHRRKAHRYQSARNTQFRRRRRVRICRGKLACRYKSFGQERSTNRTDRNRRRFS